MNCLRLRTVLEALAAKHHVDLYGGGRHGRIECRISGMLPFIVERCSPCQIRCGHYLARFPFDADSAREHILDPKTVVQAAVGEDGTWEVSGTQRRGGSHEGMSLADIEVYARLIETQYVRSDRAKVAVAEDDADANLVYR